jgi:hypothetical protein
VWFVDDVSNQRLTQELVWPMSFQLAERNKKYSHQIILLKFQ